MNLNQISHSPQQLLHNDTEISLLKLMLKLNKLNNKILIRGRKSITKHILKKTDHKNGCLLLIPLSVSPPDLIIHLPYLCKEVNIKYLYLSVDNADYFRKLSSKGSLSTCCLLKLENKEAETLNEKQKAKYDLIMNEVRKVFV
ncbi:H/ACA ribonucleoprotein complex subunit 2-like protein [Cucumispora dikerogammari]|nr:H/ACA ribonucleoprotein complex subunit 2-like protein [Cucumispora dikerogammari]